MAAVLPIRGHRAYERQTRRSAAGVLRDARTRNPSEVLCIGYDASDDLFVIGSPPDPANAMWLMELAKRKLCKEDGNG